METTVRSASGATIDIEDPGFNSILSLDMLNLAQLELIVRRPYRALYWYLGARSVQDAVMRSGYDPDSGFFFPTSASDDQPVKHYYALSAAPLLFTGSIGDNLAATIIREYLLQPVARAPESPYNALGGPTTSWVDDFTTTDRLLKTHVMLEALETHGFRNDADAFRRQAVENAVNELAELPAGANPSAHHAYLIDRIENGGGSLGRRPSRWTCSSP